MTIFCIEDQFSSNVIENMKQELSDVKVHLNSMAQIPKRWEISDSTIRKYLDTALDFHEKMKIVSDEIAEHEKEIAKEKSNKTKFRQT